jgi:hypothetical protein
MGIFKNKHTSILAHPLHVGERRKDVMRRCGISLIAWSAAGNSADERRAFHGPLPAMLRACTFCCACTLLRTAFSPIAVKHFIEKNYFASGKIQSTEQMWQN